METISLYVDKDDNMTKYITIIRKRTGKAIGEIKASILSNSAVIICDYYDKESLISLSECISELHEKGAKFKIYEDEREITLEMLCNLINMFSEITKEREELDDLMLEE